MRVDIHGCVRGRLRDCEDGTFAAGVVKGGRGSVGCGCGWIGWHFFYGGGGIIIYFNDVAGIFFNASRYRFFPSSPPFKNPCLSCFDMILPCFGF